MANSDNLKPVRSESEARELGRKGGIKSGEARRRKRDMKTAAKVLLNMAVAEGKTAESLRTMGFSEEDLTNQMAMLARIFTKVMATGDVRGAEFLRDTAGYNLDTRLKEAEFKFEKDKAKGMGQEVEDLSETDGKIYGSAQEKDDTV